MEVVLCKGSIKKETEKAVLFWFTEAGSETFDTPKKLWIPLSQVHSMTRKAAEGEDLIQISKWIASKIDLIS